MALQTVSDQLRQHAADWELYEQAKTYAVDYMKTVLDRPVFPEKEAIEGLKTFRKKLPENPVNPYDILTQLHRFGSPATVAQTGGRYFGFVNGGIIPAALAAKWLGDVWDQNAAMYVISPTVSVLEDVCEEWLVDLLGLPEKTAAGFVSGSATATLCGLAAGRDYLLRRQGWDVNGKGLFGAPEIRVVLGGGAHSTVYKALSVLGLGKDRLIKVPEDAQGRIRPEALPALDERTLLILQAGNVNSGAFDPFAEICHKARAAGAWTHIDGAFGLWAAASPQLKKQGLSWRIPGRWMPTKLSMHHMIAELYCAECGKHLYRRCRCPVHTLSLVKTEMGCCTRRICPGGAERSNFGPPSWRWDAKG